ncbi:MAG: hypothetical protein QM727_06450 [Niabella sp.]
MKRFITFVFTVLAVLSMPLSGKSQTLKEVLDNKDLPVYYFGMDFTKAHLLGDAGANTQDIVDRQYAAINDVIVNEPKKYDLAGAFRRADIKTDLSAVHKRNSKIDPDKIISTSSEDYGRLTEAEVKSLIKGFDAGNKSGTGVLFVVDAMSKTEKAVNLWVTIFDIKTKKVLLTERVESPLGMGFGFRNYWASSFKKLIDNISNKKYKEWTR